MEIMTRAWGFRIIAALLFGGAIGAVAIVHSSTAAAPALPKVAVMRAPHGGIQPQTALDSQGVLHMIYFEGNAAAGNIEYVRRTPEEKNFSAPIRVNSQPWSAVAIGTVRGPQMAIGRRGRVYVIWFGSSQAKPRGPNEGTPVLYSRLNDSGTAFEPQRNLDQYTREVDGGISIAADQQGDVYAVWHARGKTPGEANRRVYLARSTDDGKAFAREVPVSPGWVGACGCCGMRAFVSGEGTLYILYRAAEQGIHRDMTLLVSRDRGNSFRRALLSSWKLNACPMSTDFLSEGGGRVLAAWERAGEVYFSRINPETLKVFPALAAPGHADDRKHPAVAENSRGQVLLAWTEGTAWNEGGSIAWQLFDSAGRPEGPEGRAAGAPAWDLPSVVVSRMGNFTIAY